MSSALHLRPRGFSELIDAAFHVMRARFSTFATAGAILMIPGMGITMLMAGFMPAAGATTVPDPSAGTLFGMVGLGLVALFLYPLVFGAIVHVAARTYLGEPVELSDGFARARARYWTLVRATISKYGLVFLFFMAAGLFASMFAIASPALGVAAVVGVMFASLYLLVMWAMTTPVVIMEDVKVGTALERSANLTKGARLRIIAIFGVLWALVWAAMMTVAFAGTLVLRSPVAAQLVSNLISVVTYPFIAVLLAVVYFDLRIRNEGFDLEVMAGGLQDAAVLPPAPSGARQPA